MINTLLIIWIGILMLSMGITLKPSDFLRVAKKPLGLVVGFLLCYGLCPLLAVALCKMFQLPQDLATGIILLSAINGAQASNLCTYIAKGDVALSVSMTTLTTACGVFMTPLLCQYLLGTTVPVNAVAIATSCAQVVLAPILLGMTANKLAPKVVEKVTPITPVIGVLSTCMLLGAAVSDCAPAVKAVGAVTHCAVLSLHLLSAVCGYYAPKLLRFPAEKCRTIAIEAAMKSSAFGYLLAKLHFSGAYNTRVVSAISMVYMVLVGASLGVWWRYAPLVAKHDEEKDIGKVE